MAEAKSENKTVQSQVNINEKAVFTWSAPEFVSYTKTSGWFLIISAVALVLIGFFVWQKNWTAVGVVVAASAALMLQARAKPKSLTCSLYRSGIVIDDRVYPFDTLKSFWIVFGEHPFVRFSQVRRISTHISLPIAEEDPEQIRLFLAKYLPEDENNGEDLADTIQRWLRF